ncbi:MAG TPA: FAD-binding oxidoreductase [Gaiellaceae bacterium]|nr:FAD-binding oxidoreductase [Gaiellaceae bacterium]
MSNITTAATAARQELGASFAGELIGPDDAGYDEARTLYNAMIDKRPALIARPADAAGVARIVAFAREHGLALAVHGGGHNGPGFGSVDDGVVCDLSLLREIAVDPAARTVDVGGGATWGEVDRATHEHGLATVSGIISTTGVGGLTLGGGHGHLSRKHGLTIDNLVEADVVLADGHTVRASADENPDLFWALRGGGGNFGVVTRFRYRLHPVTTVIAGPTFWPVEQAREVLRAYAEFLPQAPRELNGFFAFHIVPPAPLFPEELHLRKVCGVVWCFLGTAAEAAKLLAPMLEVGTPLLHGPGEVPYPALQGLFDDLYAPGLQWYWRGDFVRDLPEEAIEQHACFGEEIPTLHSLMHLYPIDGAVHDVGREDTAWAYRDVTWSAVFAGVDPDPANADAIRRWSVGYQEATHPYSAGGAYINFMMDEGEKRVRATYGPNYERLTRVKAAYDPDNVFRVNQNIRPAA